MKLSLSFFILVICNISYAISPADYCASKPTVACEILNVDLTSSSSAGFKTVGPSTSGGVLLYATVLTKYCKNGQFLVFSTSVTYSCDPPLNDADCDVYSNNTCGAIGGEGSHGDSNDTSSSGFGSCASTNKSRLFNNIIQYASKNCM